MPTAKEILASLLTIKRLDHVKGPFTAISASSKTDDWPYWYVAGADGRTNAIDGGDRLPLTDRETAEALAHLWNREDEHHALPQ